MDIRPLLAVTLLATMPACATHGARGERTPAPEASDDRVHTAPATRVEELLDGRFAGVRLLRHPGGQISVQIRGVSTVHGYTQPLYVVDGVPYDQGDPLGLLSLSPQDIVRIEVLKDIGSTAQYGVRGANGVILITTRGADLR